MDETGQWAWVVDADWRLVFVTDAVRYTYAGGTGAMAEFAIGRNVFGTENLEFARSWRFGPNSTELMALILRGLGGWMLTDMGGIEALHGAVDPDLWPVVEELSPIDEEAITFVAAGMGISQVNPIPCAALRVRRRDGALAGTLLIPRTQATMAQSAFASMFDIGHLARVQQVAIAGRRPAALLFADLEGSSTLARRLSTASYFAVGRRLVRAADHCVIDAGGIVGRHVGDGIVAFFPAETAGSESAAALGCIEAARALRAALDEVAARSELEPEVVSLRFGLHWGSTLYIGAITTGGRSEVTALGDAANEAARIEACATGGRMLASKDLLERLGPEDAAALGLDPDGLGYTLLGELDTATEKARRDAPAIPVCAI
jgi:class 3 adenylate cyclase